MLFSYLVLFVYFQGKKLFELISENLQYQTISKKVVLSLKFDFRNASTDKTSQAIEQHQ